MIARFDGRIACELRCCMCDAKHVKEYAFGSGAEIPIMSLPTGWLAATSMDGLAPRLICDRHAIYVDMKEFAR